MIRAAGILIISKEGRVLFLKRGPGSDNPGEWCFPGGRLEGKETSIEAAIRETEEETGGVYKFKVNQLAMWTRRVALRETTGTMPTPPPSNTASTPPLVTLEALAQPAPLPEAIQLPGEEVDFTTYIIRGVEEKAPNELLSGEHTAHAWAAPADAPIPLHPGCRIALQRFSMNELHVAEAIAAGELTSPQRYGNFMMFNIRITGTGVAYRHRKLGGVLTKKDAKGRRVDAVSGREIVRDEEYAYKNPDDYLNDEFLARCNGLPVVMEHPTTLALDHDEWEKRVIGTVFKPFIKGNEVWAVCKIYNEDAMEVMTEQQLSTSPGVVWRDANANVKTVIDGHNFLLEGKPSLMDHIAVCYQGVWDKGGRPVGVETSEARKDSIMTAEELKKWQEEHDKRVGGLETGLKTLTAGQESITGALGKIVSRFDSEDEAKDKERKDSATKRVDEFKFSARKDEDKDEDYKSRHDAEEQSMCDAMMESGKDEAEAKKDAKGRRDAAEKEEEDARKDKARKDEEDKARKDSVGLGLENKALRERLEKLEGRVPEVQPKDADVKAFGAVQSRFDEVFSALAMNTPRPMQGESLLNYRKRGVIELKKFSTTFKDAEINVAAADEGIFTPVEKIILGEAMAMARSDATVPPGTLREVPEVLPGGHKGLKFYGNPADWMADFAPSLRFAAIQKHNANGER